MLKLVHVDETYEGIHVLFFQFSAGLNFFKLQYGETSKQTLSLLLLTPRLSGTRLEKASFD